MGKCLTCLHSEREMIDRALVAGEPLRRLGARYGISKSSLSDHKRNHLAESLRAAAVRVGEQREDGLLEELRELQLSAKQILREARRSKDHGAALGALAALYKHIELLAKMRPPAPPAERRRVILEFTPMGPLTRTIEDDRSPILTAVERPALSPAPEEPEPNPQPDPIEAAPLPPVFRADETVRSEPEAPVVRKRRIEVPWPERDPWAETRARDRAEDAENAAAARGVGRAKYSGF